uniref:Uncharacterized protein n=1 Tax=Anguilla anguilla TaxID=7936 RepID=A0A0E9R727_ANGAN
MECFWWGEIFGTVIPMHGCTVLAFLSLGCWGSGQERRHIPIVHV